MAGWIQTKLGMEVGLIPGHIVLDGEPALPTPEKRGHSSPPLLGTCIVARRLDGSRCHLVQRPHCIRRGPSSPKKGHSPLPPIFGACLLWPNGRPSQLLLSSCFTGWIPFLTGPTNSVKTPNAPEQIQRVYVLRLIVKRVKQPLSAPAGSAGH